MYFSNGYSVLRTAIDVNNTGMLNAAEAKPISLVSMNLTAIIQKTAFNIANITVEIE
jgi:hypothetical protein